MPWRYWAPSPSLRSPEHISPPSVASDVRHQSELLSEAGDQRAAVAVSQSAEAQTYLARPITMIVPFEAGGPTDAIARLLPNK